MILNNFDWGDLPNYEINNYLDETGRHLYEKFFQVEKNDIVVDIGAFVGSFTYNILNREPEHCWVIEPVEKYFRLLYKNLRGHQVSFIRGAISDKPKNEITWIGGSSDSVDGVIFKDFITKNCIDKIDFLKTDCEGGEYFIFTNENIEYLKNNVKKIAGEFHLRSEANKEKFRYFRDNFLTQFDKYEIYSYDDINIKWDLFNEHFIQYYTEVTIYIDNRK